MTRVGWRLQPAVLAWQKFLPRFQQYIWTWNCGAGFPIIKNSSSLAGKGHSRLSRCWCWYRRPSHVGFKGGLEGCFCATDIDLIEHLGSGAQWANMRRKIERVTTFKRPFYGSHREYLHTLSQHRVLSILRYRWFFLLKSLPLPHHWESLVIADYKTLVSQWQSFFILISRF